MLALGGNNQQDRAEHTIRNAWLAAVLEERVTEPRAAENLLAYISNVVFMQHPVPQKYIYILNTHSYLHGYSNKEESCDHREDKWNDFSTLFKMVRFRPSDILCLALRSSSKKWAKGRSAKCNIIRNLKQIAFKEKVKGPVFTLRKSYGRGIAVFKYICLLKRGRE